MSPEQNAKTPEQKADKPYVVAAREVIAEADKSAPETTERFRVVDSHVDQILQAVDNGEITGSAGVYTREQVLLQIEDFLKNLNMTDEQRKGIDPYTYIPGKDGMRASFRLLMDSDATYRDFKQSLEMHVAAEHEKRAKLLSPENIQEMGDVEVSAAGVDEPMVEARRAAAGIIEGIPAHLMSPSVSLSVEAAAVLPKATTEQASEVETELQMNGRFLRESQAELQDLYAQLRGTRPNTYEADVLENQIKHAKEDVGKYARIVAKLSGSNNWH